MVAIYNPETKMFEGSNERDIKTSEEINNIVVRTASNEDTWFNDFMKQCSSMGCSDIALPEDEKPRICYNSEWFTLHANTLLRNRDIKNYITAEMGDSAMGLLSKKEDLNFAIEVKDEITFIRDKNNSRFRYRVNATNFTKAGVSGKVDLTYRSIPEEPWEIERHELPDDLLEAFRAEKGLNLLVGTTGSGKTTVIASLVRDMIERLPIRVLEYSNPIEYVYDTLSDYIPGHIVQCEIGKDLQSFAEAIPNSLRRNPTAAVIGEARSPEEIKKVVLAPETGMLTLSTIHASGAGDTISRIVQVFTPTEQNMISVSLISQINVVLWQHLIDRKGGGRVPMREYYIFSDDDREAMYQMTPEQMKVYVGQQARLKGTDKKSMLKKLLDEDKITQDTYERNIKTIR